MEQFPSFKKPENIQPQETPQEGEEIISLENLDADFEKENEQLAQNLEQISDTWVEKSKLDKLSDKGKLLLARLGRVASYGASAAGALGIASAFGVGAYEYFDSGAQGFGGVENFDDMKSLALIGIANASALAVLAGSLGSVALDKIAKKLRLESEMTHKEIPSQNNL